MEKGSSGEFIELVRQSGVVAVLVIDDAANAVPLARALLAGGISAIELTLRTPAALDSLKAIRREVPEIVAGIGTILLPEQVEQVVACGGAFGVAPGTNPRVIQAAARAGLPFAPGVITPTEIELALEHGCRLLKFFPAEASGGLKFLKSMAAPFEHLNVQFMPLGGLNLDNMTDYLSEPLVAALGGSWIAPRDLIQRQDWPAIEQNARLVSDKVRQLRSPVSRTRFA